MKVGNIGRIGAFFIALLLSTAALAAGHKLTWTAPTTRTDGSALPAEEIQGYELVYADGKALALVKANASSHQITPPVGKTCYKARTIDTGGRTSAWTPEVCVTIAVAAPKAPSVKIEVTK